MLCPSTPAAPLLASTFVQAAFSVSGANTLSINAYHLPPLTPLTSADSMRFVQTEASAHDKSCATSPPCIAATALRAVCCFGLDNLASPFLPPFPRPGLCCPVLSRTALSGDAAAVL